VGCVNEPTRVVAVPAISEVQSEIKRQIGVYLVRTKTQAPTKRDKGLVCGNGQVNFDITNVKVELTTTSDKTKDTTGGLSGPINAVTVGVNGESKNEIVDTQTLTYNLWLVPGQARDYANDPNKPSPIADALIGLRDGLIAAGKKEGQPCFFDFNPKKPTDDAGNTFKLALTISHDKSGGVAISVGILSFGRTHEEKDTASNTLTVSFVQTGLDAIQYAQEAVDANCKYPRKPSCDADREALKALLDKGVGQSITLDSL
jgi:hypothetical protein